MEANAEVLQDSLMTLGEARLPRCDQTAPRQFMPGFPKTGSPADPQDILQITKSARALLDIRLKIVRRIMIAAVALFLLTLLGLKEKPRLEPGLHCADKFIEQLPISRQLPGFEQAGLHHYIFHRLFCAMGDGTDAVANFQPDIP